MELPAAVRAFRSRNYRLFVAGQLVSLIGTWMQMVAQSWLIYRLTGSAALLGLIGFAGQIPVFVIAPFGGVVADRAHRQRVLVGTQSAMMALAFILAALTLAGRVQVWHLFVLDGRAARRGASPLRLALLRPWPSGVSRASWARSSSGGVCPPCAARHAS